jgi:peroxiredoxin (alkyl hydroperoxide reductase subunit C)
MSQQVAQVRKPAPNFKGAAYFNKDFVDIELSTLLKEGKWIVLFFWPLDFTFVCPTEIKAFSERAEKFKAANITLVGCSVDSKFSHHAWCTSTAKGSLGPVNFPMLSDIGGNIARQYGCLIQDGDDAGVAFRATYIIDPNGILRHYSINDLPLGRNPDEVLRLVQGLQFFEENGEVCPANWQPGQKGLIPKLE